MGGRVHVVLVPGFGGFDALGAMKYYAGVEPIFRECTKEGSAGYGRAVLHFFDNEPTASVETRAKKLKVYLDKRVWRREIDGNDQIVLVGHSTGGLDIRRLVDGEASDDLRERIRKVVFLSVPHGGTNIADFVAEHRSMITEGVKQLRARIDDPLAKLANRIADFHVWGAPLRDADLDVVEAARDVLRETSVKNGPGWIAAQSRQDKSDVMLWLDDMRWDFFAIGDLKSRSLPTGDEWKKRWERIAVRTFATIGERPFAEKDLGQHEALRSVADVIRLGLAPGRMERSDFTYRLCYAACSRGPFDRRPGVRAKWFGARRPTTWDSNGDSHTPEPWENDSIVNTTSMFWPFDDEPRLVLGDHGDIIGHYTRTKREPNADEPPRLFESYDLLGSRTASAFDFETFNEVWTDVFSFATLTSPR